ncbi:MAG TPA: dephospho-CoA kinase [Hydrogenophaga sp.]|uniref:dephospho-CoA kinase n=1 Tax=Hydrogenophaga sp. TaxID=1904254 RepID=UPI002C409F0C|nr:dephospho-CoA kinase [Hydrogenophaga sp.]HMN92557.1 dephospho-CoA kinase [Hydrogenophaga sp.]HMP10429.1 dephospho-CoA kinase [Hydrogenophaga sp.]
MLRLGLTGGIGSGKSTVARLMADLGAVVLDADAISRATTQAGGSAMAAIAHQFGADFVNAEGALDRDRMRRHVFEHPQARHQLEQIIHPLVAQAMRAQTEAARQSGTRCLVHDIPLLVESGRWRHALDRVLVVDCSETAQRRRVKARNGWDDDTITSVLRNQSPRLVRLAAADAVLFNEHDGLAPLTVQVRAIAVRFGL